MSPPHMLSNMTKGLFKLMLYITVKHFSVMLGRFSRKQVQSNTYEASCSLTQHRGFFGIVNCYLLVTCQTLYQLSYS